MYFLLPLTSFKPRNWCVQRKGNFQRLENTKVSAHEILSIHNLFVVQMTNRSSILGRIDQALAM